MSIKLMSQVWELQLSHEMQSVLLALADHAHDDGSQCYPGVDYLAWKTGYDRRSVQRILRKLEASALIIVVADSQGGRGQATEYLIDLSIGVKKDPFQPRHRAAYEAERAAPTPPFASEKGDKMPPFTEGQKGGIRDTKRAASETERAASGTQKGGTHAAPTVSNHQEPPLEHTHTVAAPEQPAPVEAAGVCVSKSKFSLDELRSYASNQQPILGTGWIVTAQDGRYDALVEEWFTHKQPASSKPLRDTSQCPDCQGTGFSYPEGPARGAAKCKHPRLGDQVRAGPPAQAQAGIRQSTRPERIEAALANRDYDALFSTN